MTENANPLESRAKALYKQGFASFAKGEVEDAIARYREAIDVAPGLAIAWNVPRQPVGVALSVGA